MSPHATSKSYINVTAASNPTHKTGFIGWARTIAVGLKIAFACYPCSTEIVSSHPLSTLSYVQIIRPVPHFPDSQCLVLKPTRLLSNYHTSTLSYLLNATFLFTLSYNEINCCRYKESIPDCAILILHPAYGVSTKGSHSAIAS